MAKKNKFKQRENVEQILDRMSERIFPAELGQKPVKIDSQEADGDGVLHNLLYGREYYPVRTLIEAGADVNLVGNVGYTPLHVAAWRNHPEAIELLLNAGANRSARCEQGKTPLDIAEENDYREVARLFETSVNACCGGFPAFCKDLGREPNGHPQ